MGWPGLLITSINPPRNYGRLSGKIDLHWMTEKFLVRARPIPLLSLLD
jgi:hypothetical protein